MSERWECYLPGEEKQVVLLRGDEGVDDFFGNVCCFRGIGVNSRLLQSGVRVD